MIGLILPQFRNFFWIKAETSYIFGKGLLAQSEPRKSGIGGLDESVRLAAPGSKTLCYVEREAFNCECERHDLLVRKMQGMRVKMCFFICDPLAK